MNEQCNYYPFGLTFNSYSRENSVKQNYQYNGKELQDELNLGWTGYGARMYMADIGRWATVDPLAEISRRWSPYTYVYDNPLRFIDPDEMAADDTNRESHRADMATRAERFQGRSSGSSGFGVAENVNFEERRSRSDKKNTNSSESSKEVKEDQQDEYPIKLKTASLNDVAATFKDIHQRTGSEDTTFPITHFFDIDGISGGYNNWGVLEINKSFNKGQVNLQILVDNKTNLEDVHPYYPGVQKLRDGKSWNTDETKVPTSYPPLFGRPGVRLVYPYQIAITSSHSTNARVALLQFKDLKTYQYYKAYLQKK